MNALSRAMLLMAVSGAAVFCQTMPSDDPLQIFCVRHDIAATDSPRLIGALTLDAGMPAVPVTSRTAQPSTSSAYKSGNLGPMTLLRFDSGYARQDRPAISSTLMPFSYTVANDRFDYFPVKVGPLRYTFWPRNSQFNRPAGGRLQSLVDGVLRHYTSRSVIPVNERCLRSLSCNSLYEQAVRRRAAPSIAR